MSWLLSFAVGLLYLQESRRIVTKNFLNAALRELEGPGSIHHARCHHRTGNCRHSPNSVFGLEFSVDALNFEMCRGTFRFSHPHASADTGKSMRSNKDNCLQIVEQICQILYTVVLLYTTESELKAVLPTALLYDIGKFTELMFCRCSVRIEYSKQDSSKKFHSA
jgi:hypothetical protein